MVKRIFDGCPWFKVRGAAFWCVERLESRATEDEMEGFCVGRNCEQAGRDARTSPGGITGCPPMESK